MTDQPQESPVIEPPNPEDLPFQEPPVCDQLTVVEQIYFNPKQDQPEGVESRFVRNLSSQEEQTYIRRLQVTEEWMPLSLGWLTSTSLIHIKNLEGFFTQVNPTDEEREAAEKKVLELRYQGADGKWFIPPRESFRGTPSSPTTLQIRCQSGTAKCLLHVFPE